MGVHWRVVEEIGSDRGQELSQPHFEAVTGGAIGMVLDGGYGIEQIPHDLGTIADVQKVPDLLRKRRYGEADVAAVMHENWLVSCHKWSRGPTLSSGKMGRVVPGPQFRNG
jgi:microsomal dipeptidase-like Zn-dependent dipeptidase